ncbi:MAG: serine hydrolase domain-containing protein [Rhodocyclaceae bacterium]
MRYARASVVVSLLVVSLLGCGGGGGSDRPAAQPYAELIEELRRELPAAMAEMEVVGLSIALVDDQQVVWESGFGVREVGRGEPVRADTPMRIGSISKLFTATAVMQQVEQGRLRLDAPLAEALPGFTVRSRFHADAAEANWTVSLRQMLTHHSGLPETSLAGIGMQPGIHPGNLAQAVNGVHLANRPGQLLAYSNLAFDLLGTVVEQAGGRAFERYLADEVLGPLGMAHSTLRSAAASGQAYGHMGGVSVGTQADTYDQMPAGGMWSSASELTRFMRMVFNGGSFEGRTIVRPDTLAAMLVAQHPGNPFDLDQQIGLGWFVSGSDSKLIAPGVATAGHDGSTGAYNSNLMLLPDHRLGVVILTNSDTGKELVDAVATAILRRMWAAKMGKPAPAEPLLPATQARMATEADLADYPGIYSLTMGPGVIEFSAREGGLQLTSSLTEKPEQLMRDEDGWYRLPDATGAPARDRRIRLETIGDERALVADMAGAGRLVVATRIMPKPIPEAWLARLGDYALADVLEISLVAADGWLAVSLGDGELMHLHALDSDTAVVAGIGRNKGDFIQVESDGSLRALDVSFTRKAH